jgi:hypothetical protein
MPPLSALVASTKFFLHRYLGFAYLVQFGFALYMWKTAYASFLNSPLIWALPLTGAMQSATAARRFKFLPKKVDPGYYSDRGSVSYEFVLEDSFLSGLLLFQWLYYSDRRVTDLSRDVTTAVEVT